jgi:hypothetical protein
MEIAGGVAGFRRCRGDLPVVGQVALPAGQPVYLALQQLSSGGVVELPVYRDVNQNATGEPELQSRRALHGFRPAESFCRRRGTSPRDCERVVVETPDPISSTRRRPRFVSRPTRFGMTSSNRSCTARSRGACACSAGADNMPATHSAGTNARRRTSRALPNSRNQSDSRNHSAADEQFNLARSEAAIHSNGDMSKNHYDMNLVAVDAFFRHLLWTGDTNYAAKCGRSSSGISRGNAGCSAANSARTSCRFTKPTPRSGRATI